MKKHVTTYTRQIVERKLGAFATNNMGNDLYSLMEAVDLMVQDLGENYIAEQVQKDGKNWNEIKSKLLTLKKILREVKLFYDGITDKKFEKKDVNETSTQLMFKRQYSRNIVRIPLMEGNLYYLFNLILNSSDLADAHISQDAFKVLEHQGMTKLDTTRIKKTDGVMRE